MKNTKFLSLFSVMAMLLHQLVLIETPMPTYQEDMNPELTVHKGCILSILSIDSFIFTRDITV